jgi:hypothetical protein
MNCCGTSFGQWREDSIGPAQDWERQPRPSGNQAFDEYRTATLRRLEEEQPRVSRISLAIADGQGQS